MHALIIGVGAYPHCGKGASDPLLAQLYPLKEAVRSAVELAQYLVSAPGLSPRLASVDLLVSGDAPVPEGWGEVRRPTRANVEAAFHAWRQRGESHPDNVLVFYFAGHGLQRSELLVLPDDIGENPYNPLVSAIDVSLTKIAMSRCTARTQLWLIDACRSAPRELRERLGPIGSSLMDTQPTGYGGLDSTFLSATTDFQIAHGVPGGLTLFSSAVLHALRGGAARLEDGSWIIRTGTLQYAINYWLRVESEKYKLSPPQQCECLGGSGERVLVRFSEPPPVRVLVDCEPAENLNRVELYLRNHTDDHRRSPAKIPWDTEVAAGTWRVGALESADKTVAACEKTSFLGPPLAREVLRWSK